MTRLGRRASLLVAFLLLTSVATAYAECAWVLWHEVNFISGGVVGWTVVQAVTSKSDCDAIVERTMKDARGAGMTTYGNVLFDNIVQSPKAGTPVRTVACEFHLPAALAQELAADFWRRYHAFCRPFHDLVATLEELRRRGKRIGVVTNGRRVTQEGTIDALGIRDLLDVVLVSDVEGVRKPDRRIFDRAVARLGVMPWECCHVGDHPEVDVSGARAAGLRAIWKRTAYWGMPAESVPVIENLGEVLLYT